MTFIEHMSELRKRLFFCIAFTILVFCFTYLFCEEILRFFAKPLLEHSLNLISTSITETFFTYINIATLCAIGISTPFYMTQIYLFIAPGLYKTEKMAIAIFFTGFIIMFLLGGLLMYYCILPNAITFLSKYGKSEILSISLHSKVGEYVSVIIHLLIGFGLVFQLPVILLLLVRIRLITTKALQRCRRFAIVIIFFSAAIATPPDIMSQIILGTIMVIMYEVTILIAKFITPKQECEDKQQQIQLY